MQQPMDNRPAPLRHTRLAVAVAVTGLLALVLSSQALARPDYRIEFILFENVDVPRDDTERWRPEVVIPNLQQAARLDDDETHLLRERMLRAQPDGYRRLESDEFVLDQEREALESSRRYRVLAHTGWQQPPHDHDEAVAIRVHAGERFTIERSLPEGFDFDTFGIAVDLRQGQRTEGIPDPWPIEAAPTGRTQQIDIYPLDGTVRLVISRYVHVYTDLHFTTRPPWAIVTDQPVNDFQERFDTRDERRIAGMPSAPDIAHDREGYPVVSYPVSLHRRMRSGEIHYLDHPNVGMVVLVSRAEPDNED